MVRLRVFRREARRAAALLAASLLAAAPVRAQEGDPRQPLAPGLATADREARFGGGQRPPTLAERVAEELRRRIEAAGDPPRIPVAGGEARAGRALLAFYERRLFRPAWNGGAGPTRLARDLVATVRLAGQEGLRPSDYRLPALEPRLVALHAAASRGERLDPAALADLEILLSDAFLVYGAHLLAGKVNPETIDSEWFADRRAGDLAAVLDTAMLTGQIDRTLTGLLPPQPGYWRLREALARYRGIADAGGWPAIPDGPALHPGDEDARVPLVRLRLEATEELIEQVTSGPDRYDDALAATVRRFQARHGLEPDGVLGRDTREALNVPVESRVHQIELNMERFRWLPQDLGSRYVAVNIAGFELLAVEDARVAMAMKVVVGRQYRRTPVFSGRMTYLVLNPYWEVPHNIAVQDKLPLIRKDPGYLAAQRMRVFRGWGAEAVEIDPDTVDWASLSARNFPYRLRQDPGPLNALGRVKLMFPNRFDVYLHDTPSRELFERAQRDFSSGCIRVEKPMDLAAWVLAPDPRWTREALEEAVALGRERTVPLPHPVPVHVLYFTAWADAEGTIHFRRDLYDRDAPLDAALHAEPAG